MKRRLLTVTGVVAAAAALSACGAVEPTDTAADVDGHTISVDDLQGMLQPIAAAGEDEVLNVDFDAETQTLPGDTARSVLALMIREQLGTAFLAEHGQAVTDADRAAAMEVIPADDPGRELPQALIDLLLTDAIGQMARARVTAPDGVQARYEEAPASVGLFCVRHIVVDTEAEADDAIAAIEAGTPFADVAAERSIEPAAPDTGGALEDPTTGACMPLDQARQQLDRTFVDAAAVAVPGELVGPVQTSFGWHVIAARPWSEVEASANGLFTSNAGDLLYSAYVADADVRVDPRYGRWRARDLSVTPLDG